MPEKSTLVSGDAISILAFVSGAVVVVVALVALGLTLFSVASAGIG